VARLVQSKYPARALIVVAAGMKSRLPGSSRQRSGSELAALLVLRRLLSPRVADLRACNGSVVLSETGPSVAAVTSDPLTWEELELPVLRWVLESRQDQLELASDRSCSEIADHLSDLEIDDAMMRLERHGLIAGSRHEGSGTTWWMQLRPTAAGLRVLGEWPPVEAATINIALAHILRALSAELSDKDQATAARRAGSALSKMSGEIVLDVVKGEVRRLGGEGAP
jgi:hypothetical protein